MEFSPNNNIVKLCLQGMAVEEKGNPEEASKLFLQAWSEAGNDFERFTAAYHVARLQEDVTDRLQWQEITLQLAMALNDDTVKAAIAPLHLAIAECYDKLHDRTSAERHREEAVIFDSTPSDKGPFYHGTRAALQVGDVLTAGFGSNYQQDLVMNHIYFTALANGAGLAASLAKGDGPERVYLVEPTGSFEDDPNVTNKKFPGNPTRSYRTEHPLRITGEVTDFTRLSPEELQQWRKKLDNNKGEIIN